MVYQAFDETLKREVAVKVLAPRGTGAAAGTSTDAEASAEAEQFFYEICSVARLSHPNIIEVYDAGFDGSCFLVMELVDGGTLRERMSRGPLAMSEVHTLARQLLPALAYAHDAGIVHCDLKPENVMLTSDGAVKITDFGVSRAIRSAVTLPSQPVLGTPAYMPPEQIRSEPVDGRADVYAAGAILYEAACGRRAFPGNTIDEILKLVLNTTPPFPPLEARYRQLGEVLMASLEKDPGARLQRADEFLRAVEAALAEAGPEPEAPRSSEPGPRDDATPRTLILPDHLLPGRDAVWKPPREEDSAHAVDLGDGPVLESVLRLTREQRSGLLVVKDPTHSLGLDFYQGSLLGISGGPSSLTLGSRLVGAGFLSTDQLEDLLERFGQFEGIRLGEVALQEGLLTRVQLYGVLRGQAEARLGLAIGMSPATARFFDGRTTGHWTKAPPLDVEQLVGRALLEDRDLATRLVQDFLQRNAGRQIRVGRNLEEAGTAFAIPGRLLRTVTGLDGFTLPPPSPLEEPASPVSLTTYLLWIADAIRIEA